MKAVAERIRADRYAASSLAATGTLGFAGSIGAFASQGPSLSAKMSASQYLLGGCACHSPSILSPAKRLYAHIVCFLVLVTLVDVHEHVTL